MGVYFPLYFCVVETGLNNNNKSSSQPGLEDGPVEQKHKAGWRVPSLQAQGGHLISPLPAPAPHWVGKWPLYICGVTIAGGVRAELP